MSDTLIIIPAYNEEKGIKRVLEGLKGIDDHADIVVVNDGSRDHTLAIIEEYPVVVISHPINLGYGAALQTAYQFASKNGYKYVVQFDADDQHHPDDLRRLIVEMRKDKDDIIIGSRMLDDITFTPGVRKRIAFLWFKMMIRLLTGKRVTDPTSGLRGLTRTAFSYYSRSPFFPNDFPDADTIIHMMYQGFSIREIPIRSQDRKEGVSQHTGVVKHAVYMMKVTISILAILLHHLTVRRGKML